MPPTGPVEMTVATDTTFTVNSFEGVVLWQGRRRPVRIIEAEGAPLLGIGLLWGKPTHRGHNGQRRSDHQPLAGRAPCGVAVAQPNIGAA